MKWLISLIDIIIHVSIICLIFLGEYEIHDMSGVTYRRDNLQKSDFSNYKCSSLNIQLWGWLSRRIDIRTMWYFISNTVLSFFDIHKWQIYFPWDVSTSSLIISTSLLPVYIFNKNILLDLQFGRNTYAKRLNLDFLIRKFLIIAIWSIPWSMSNVSLT